MAKTVVETDGNPKAASPVKVEISQKDISNTFLFDREHKPRASYCVEAQNNTEAELTARGIES